MCQSCVPLTWSSHGAAATPVTIRIMNLSGYYDTSLAFMCHCCKGLVFQKERDGTGTCSCCSIKANLTDISLLYNSATRSLVPLFFRSHLGVGVSDSTVWDHQFVRRAAAVIDHNFWKLCDRQQASKFPLYSYVTYRDYLQCCSYNFHAACSVTIFNVTWVQYTPLNETVRLQCGNLE